MRILVTGGFGFLGGRVAKYLSEKGHDVIIATRVQKPVPSWAPNITVVTVNWDDKSQLTILCKGVDIIIHASGMNAGDCSSDPVGALFSNSISTSSLSHSAVNAGVKRFIFFSTVHVYSSNLQGHISEDTCTQNLHPYATSNRAGEDSVLWLHKQGLIEVVVLRLANVFGIPVDKDVNVWSLLINDLCRQVVTTNCLVLKSSGRQFRNFISVSSFLNVIDKLLTTSLAFVNIPVFNLGNKDSFTVLEIANRIKDRYELIFQSSVSISIQFEQSPQQDDFTRLVISSQRLNHLGISIDSEVDNEIDSLIDFCKQHFV
jgi:UDP-glucose 4-epimerase